MNAYQREAVLRHVLYPVVTYHFEEWTAVLGVTERDTVAVARALGFAEREIAAALPAPAEDGDTHRSETET